MLHYPPITPGTPARLRLMPADTPSPHGSGASRVTVGTVSEGSVRGVTFPHILVGYCGWVGIELRRAQHPRFRRPPYDPLRSDFPSSVLTLA
jgi:hypothetical protein